MRLISKEYSIGDITTIMKSKEREPENEEYWCSVKIPEYKPLLQTIKADYYVSQVKINDEPLEIFDEKLLNNPPIYFVLNSNDKVDIKVRNDHGSMGLFAVFKFYDQNGNIKRFNTEYAGWTCGGSVGIKYQSPDFYKSNNFAVTKKTGDAGEGETYYCSVTVPTQEPLTQKFLVDDHSQAFKVNGNPLLLQVINYGQNIPFSYPFNAGDKIEVQIKNDRGPTSLYGEMLYYNKEGEVKKLNTNYSGWKCNGKNAIKIGSGYNNIMKISFTKGDLESYSYVCSVTIPDIEPLTQKVKVDDYLTAFKVNGKDLPLQKINLKEEIPFTWALNEGDKIDVHIENNENVMGFCSQLQYYSKGLIKNITTDYAEWTCDNIIPVRTNIVSFDKIKTISTKSVASDKDESYVCSVTLPTVEPLIQYVRVQDILVSMKVNEKQVKIHQLKKDENIPFTYILNSKDKIDFTIRNVSGKMGLSAKLRFYDEHGNIQTIATGNEGWTCDGKKPVVYENRSYSADGAKIIAKANANSYKDETYTCSITI